MRDLMGCTRLEMRRGMGKDRVGYDKSEMRMIA